MTPNHEVEALTKCRFLLYDKLTGDVLDVGSGGGAGENLTGAAFIVWRRDDPNAAANIGCVPHFFGRIGAGEPVMVDLNSVDEYCNCCHSWNGKKQSGESTECDAAFEIMCDARDACVTFRLPKTRAELEAEL